MKNGTVRLLVIGVILGIILWGGFNTALEVTNTEQFCISCHEMEATVYQELQDTPHYTNRTGVRATCPDCHVPKEWIHKIVRKIKASNEIYHKILGTIDTPEKFEAKRMQLAQNVWKSMKSTDSRECRNCHAFDSMDFDKQEARSVNKHEEMEEAGEAHDASSKEGRTCIDCHKGIAHQLPDGFDPAWNSPGE
ncbi:MAG: butanol dehydrogenase [Gammaproteobacteria bacterium]|nr:butanol dehydrogenase [Gammaproteobacteria bacterium]